MAAIEGLEYSASGLTITFGEGLIDGRAVPSASPAAVTPATTTFRGFLVSEDGDGTYTVTMGTDDVGATAALAVADALANLDVPTGGIGICAGAVNNTTTLSDIDMSVRGALPPVSANEV